MSWSTKKFYFFRIYYFVLTNVYTFSLFLHFMNIRGEFNKYPHFFLQAFKIVVENSVCYCYTSYEMNDQSYDFRFKWTATAGIGIHLLKPDGHSWWILKMQFGREEERYARKLCLNLENSFVVGCDYGVSRCCAFSGSLIIFGVFFLQIKITYSFVSLDIVFGVGLCGVL